MERLAALQLHRFFPCGSAVDPCLECVATGWKPLQSEVSTCVCHYKIRSIQNQDQSAHMFVNVAPKYDQSRLIEDLRWNRSLILPIQPKIKTLGRGVGNSVVGRIVDMWEFNRGFSAHGKEQGDERQI